MQSNQETHVEKVLKKLVESNIMKEKTRKPVGTRPGAMYGSCKVHKASVENCPPFRHHFVDLEYSYLQTDEIFSTILKP